MLGTSTNQKSKDRLFTFIFGSEQNKSWTLSLYNAINGSEYTDPELITFNTIQDFLYVSMRNDTSFILADMLNIYEHQSTYNPNMPLRMMEYAEHVYSGYIDRNGFNKYGSKQITLPVPKLAVFYNGTADKPDETILRLSDSFPEDRRSESDIEVRVRMLNFNYGHNPDIMNRCRPLEEYSWFIAKIRDYKGEDMTEAVNKALKEMPDDFVIKPFLMEHRSEVSGIIDTEYDEEKVMKAFKNEGRAEGHAEGLTEGLTKGLTKGREEGETTKLIKLIYSKLRKNKTIEQIADELEEADNITGIRDIADLIREASPNLDLDEDELAQDLLEKLNNIS